MESLARVTWLYVREDESIRVNRSGSGLSVTTNGPGYDRRVFTFADNGTASEFLKLYEDSLARNGWTLQAFVERRSQQAPGAFLDGADRRSKVPVAH